MPQDKQGASLIDLAAAPYLDFDPTTNRVILHAHHVFFDEVATTLQGIHYSQIYFNERLHDLFVRLPYERVSLEGEGNYRLRVMYNNNNLVPCNIMLFDTVFRRT